MAVVDIVIICVIAFACFLCFRRMFLNVKEGKSIDGCDGNCSHCVQCGAHHAGKQKLKKQR